jgi:hypothetical protein
MKLFENRRIGLRSVFLLSAIIFSIAEMAPAQTNGIPGSWKRVVIVDSLSLSSSNNINISEVGFIDSLNGVGFGTSFLTTSDGGKSWNLIDSATIENDWSSPFAHAVACTGPSKAIVAKPNCDMLQLDGDSIYQTDCPEDVAPFFLRTRH